MGWIQVVKEKKKNLEGQTGGAREDSQRIPSHLRSLEKGGKGSMIVASGRGGNRWRSLINKTGARKTVPRSWGHPTAF